MSGESWLRWVVLTIGAGGDGLGAPAWEAEEGRRAGLTVVCVCMWVCGWLAGLGWGLGGSG